MANYSVLVTSSPDMQAQQSALMFCDALLKAGNSLDNVFFYGPGVLAANALQSPASDETNLYQQWCLLSENHQASLLVCVTAATRRGIVDEEQAGQLDLAGHTLSLPFKQVGLGEFFARLHDCDHLVQF